MRYLIAYLVEYLEVLVSKYWEGFQSFYIIDFYFNSIVIREYAFLIPVKFMETFMTLHIVYLGEHLGRGLYQCLLGQVDW